MPNFSKCPNQEIDHAKDEDMKTHGSREAPLPVPETSYKRYVESEYSHMAGVLGFHHYCAHQLLEVDGRKVDRNVAREANGQHHVFYYDVTGPWSEGVAEKERFIEGLKKNRAKLSPREKAFLESVEAQEKAKPAP